eukprot:tig00001331_g8164.t1
MAEMTDGVIKRGAPRVEFRPPPAGSTLRRADAGARGARARSLNCGFPGPIPARPARPAPQAERPSPPGDGGRGAGEVPVSVKMRSVRPTGYPPPAARAPRPTLSPGPSPAGYDGPRALLPNPPRAPAASADAARPRAAPPPADTYFFDEILDARPGGRGTRGTGARPMEPHRPGQGRLSIPVVGTATSAAWRTRCGCGRGRVRRVMAGRGAACDPWLFREIRARLAGHPRSPRNWAETERFVVSYFESVLREARPAPAAPAAVYPEARAGRRLRTRLLKFVPEDHDGEATLRLLLSLMAGL